MPLNYDDIDEYVHLSYPGALGALNSSIPQKYPWEGRRSRFGSTY